MNSPEFAIGKQTKGGLRVEDQRKIVHHESGSIGLLAPLHNVKTTDMSSVSQLEGLERNVQRRFESNQPTVLLNSPTFNTLDNRFVEQLNTDNSRYNCGGLGPDGEQNQVVQNVFTNSTWPGL